MHSTKRFLWPPWRHFDRLGLISAVAIGIIIPRAHGDSRALREGDVVKVGGRAATLKKLDTLPYVESDYTKRFRFDSHENPKLKELRTRYKLDDVIAPGRYEFDQQVLLMDWVHHQFRKFGRPSTDANGALEILRAIEEGNTFFCTQYAQLLVSAAASLGWVDRPLALRRHKGVAQVGGSTEHSVTEIWSNQHRKWIMLDPTSNMYLERNGVPLNAWEIRQEWFYQDGTNLTFVAGNRRYRKADLPISLKHFAGFGDLAVHPDELDKYGFIGYIPNTDLMDRGFDYAKMFIVKDQLCDGTRWHVRTAPADPANDPYFPIGQAALSLGSSQHYAGAPRGAADGGIIRATLKTLTPNFKCYEKRVDGGYWETTDAAFTWKVHSGINRLEARTINHFGVSGSVSTAVIEVAE